MSANPSLQERKDLLFGMYQENCAHARHYEALRLSVTSIVIAATLGVIGVIGHGGLKCGDWSLSVGLMIIGIYGTIFTRTYFKTISCHQQMAEGFLDQLVDLLFGSDEAEKKMKLEALRKTLDGRKVSVFRMFWPLTITVIGAVVTVYVLYPHLVLGLPCEWDKY